MLERTDEDGILYIPGWHYDIPGNSDEENSYRCRVNWNISDCEKTLEFVMKRHRFCNNYLYIVMEIESQKIIFKSKENKFAVKY